MRSTDENIAEQARLSGEQLKEMKFASEDTKKAISAATRLAIAAEGSRAIAEETMRRQLRAYIFYAGAGIAADTQQPSTYIANIHVKNSGQTPAYHVFSWINAEVKEYPLHTDLPMIDPANVTSDLGAGTGFIMEHRINITQSELVDIRAGTKSIYIWATVRYLDIFGIRHYSNFRLRSDREIGPNMWQLRTISKGKDAD